VWRRTLGKVDDQHGLVGKTYGKVKGLGKGMVLEPTRSAGELANGGNAGPIARERTVPIQAVVALSSRELSLRPPRLVSTGPVVVRLAEMAI
jgi:hypothetical protein